MKKIGFFDSGIGGLTVLHEAFQVLPHEDFIYFSDGKNAPYGNKPKEQIKLLTFDAVEFMLSKYSLKALVVACNTATSIAIDDLRKRYDFPIIGMEPAVKPAIALAKSKRVLVFATELTLEEVKFKDLVAKFDTHKVIDYVPLQALVGIAERFEFDEKTILEYLEKQLVPLHLQDYGAVVLGCTHFPYFKNYFKQLFNAPLIDGNGGTVKRLVSLLGDDLNERNGSILYYISKEETKAEVFEKYLALL